MWVKLKLLRRTNLGWKRQLLGHFREHRLHLAQLDTTSDLYYQPAALHRSHVVVDGTFPAAHALTQSFPGDGFVRRPEAPQRKRGAGINAAVDGEPHHLHVTPVQVSSAQSLQTETCDNNEVIYKHAPCQNKMQRYGPQCRTVLW